MMEDRGVSVNYSTDHRWVLKLIPTLEVIFRQRKRSVNKSGRLDEKYISVNGQWK